MEKYHRPIASITLQHEFYVDKNLHAATIVPFPETALFFKNYRIIFKRKSHYYVLLQEAEVESNIATIPFGPKTHDLCFGVKFNDAHYQIRSGLNFDPRQNKIVVETEKEETISENNIMPCWNLLKVQGDEAIVITNKNEEIVFSSEADNKNVFDNLDQGTYKANGSSFFKHNTNLEWDAVIIFSLSENANLIEKKIIMPAGAYHWRYQIQKKFSQHHVLSIVEENELLSFLEQETPKEGHAVFFSKEPVKLSEQAAVSLSLYNNETVIKKYLPLPELANARFLSPEKKSLVLEAYITI